MRWTRVGRLLVWSVLALGGGLLLASCEASPETTFVVTTTADGSDAVPGDGICEMTPGSGDCSLRAAIDEVNAGTPEPPFIDLPAGRYEIQPGPDDDTNATGDLDLAPAAGMLQINGPDAVIDGLGGAGPIDIRAGHVTLARVAVTNGGDAIRVAGGAEVTVVLAAVHASSGAGVRVDAGAEALILQSTVSSNAGAGIDNAGALDLVYATVTANGSGGVAGSGTGVAWATIIADQGSGADCSVALDSQGDNLDSDGSCSLDQPSDQSAPAHLAPLTTDPVPFHVPDPVSPAVDAIPVAEGRCGSGGGIIDQRKVERPINGSCDRGALEAAAPPTELVVDDAADATDATPGNGRCDTALGGCSLRAAIDEVRAGSDLPIVIAPGIDPVLSRTGADDANATGDLDIITAVSITGSASTVDANLIDRAFHVRPGGSLTLTGVSITRGRADTGGAIRVDAAADATITDATFTDNAASGTESCAYNDVFFQCGGEGGGGAVWAGGTVTIDRSTFTDNETTGGVGCVTSGFPRPFTSCTWADGGAIEASATTSVQRSTFSGNRVHHGQGGAMHGGEARASTFVDNGAEIPYDIFAADSNDAGRTAAATTLAGSVLTGPSPLCGSPLPSGGHNVTSDSSCGAQPSDHVDTDPLLGPLADNGGATATFLPYANSPVLDAVPAGTPGLCDGTIPTDQRQVARPAGAGCDAGSVEGADVRPGAGVDLVVDDPGDAPDTAPGDRTCATAASTCTVRAAVDEANVWGRWPSTITIADGIDPTLSITGADPTDANLAGDLDVRADITLRGGGATLDAAGIDRAIDVFPRPQLPVGPPPPDRVVIIEDLTIVNGSADRGGAIRAGAGQDLTLDGVELRDNTASVTGGALVNGGGIVTIAGSTVEGNRASTGGAISTSGTLIVRETTLRANVASSATASAGGGAINQSAGSLLVSRSLFADNVAASTPAAPRGGAVAQFGGSATITDSTFTGNQASGTFASSGGAIAAGGTMDLRLSTITGGSAALGAGLSRFGAFAGTFTITGAILELDRPDCYGTITSGGGNVSSDTSCALTDPDDVSSTPAQLGPLADNGGPTQTRLPAQTSPAVDRVPFGATSPCNATTPDQRGVARPQGARCDAGAVELETGALEPLALTVDDAADVRDATPIDGICDTGDGSCTLRAAIDQANAWPTADTITIAPGIDPVLAVAGPDEDANASGDLDITGDVVIDGGGATVDAAGIDRVLHVVAPTTITDLTLTGGSRSDVEARGGAILHAGPSLALDGVRVTGNRLSGARASGAGLATTSGTVTVVGSTFDRNEALAWSSTGGAISTTAPLAVERSTFSANVAPSGSAVDASGAATVDLRSVTATRNGSAALRTSGSASITVSGSAIESSGDACFGPGLAITSGGYNVVDDSSCGLGATGDQQGTAPEVAPLADNGGPTPSQLPFAGAPVVDAIPVGTAGLCDGPTAVDQRGVARPQGAGCDIGAVEGSGADPLTPLALTVDDAADAPDAAPGDGVCATGSGDCTLRAAIDEANLWPGQDTITIASGVDPELTRAGPLESQNRTGDLDIVDPLTVVGGGATIDGGTIDRVFDVASAHLDLQDLTISGGAAVVEPERPGSGGGGVRATASTITVDGVTFDTNRAPSGGAIHADQMSSVAMAGTRSIANEAQGPAVGSGEGGAVWAPTLTVTTSTFQANRAAHGGGAVLTGTFQIDRSTFVGNHADGDGGAIQMLSSGEEATVSSSTFVANTAGGAGGAVMGGYSSPGIRILASTLTANRAPVGAGVATVNSGTVAIGGSLLDNAGSECEAYVIDSLGFNVVADATCSITPTDRPGVLALVSPLADNGGPTATQLPLGDSPAIDAIPAGTPGLCDASIPTDQRGVARPVGGGCDIGAVEGSTGAPSVPLALVVDTATDGSDLAPGDGVCDTGAGGCTLRAAVDEADAWPTADAITIGAGIDPVLTTAGRDEDGNRSGDLDIAHPVTIHGGGATIDASGLDRAIHVHATVVDLEQLTVTGGRQADHGGAIEVENGSLRAARLTLVGNEAWYVGGAIHGRGLSTIELVESSISDNTANVGAGVAVIDDATLEVDRSTIDANAVRDTGTGGGIYAADRAVATVTRSTLSANRARNGGGVAAINWATVSLTAVTLVDNVASTGSSVSAVSAVTVRGSVLAASTGSNCHGPVVSQGHNLVSDSSCAFAAPGDLSGTAPMLGALQDNGGPTRTHLPAATSPAVDAIPTGTSGLCDAALTTDQRGATRPAGGACDRGAVERQPSDP